MMAARVFLSPVFVLLLARFIGWPRIRRLRYKREVLGRGRVGGLGQRGWITTGYENPPRCLVDYHDAIGCRRNGVKAAFRSDA